MLEKRKEILEGLVDVGKLGAKAEDLSIEKLLKSTLLVPNHLHLLEPNILLILGGRGAGKSHLFRFINSEEGQKFLYKDKSHLANSLWVTGFANEASFPDSSTFNRFAKGRDDTDLLDFWLGLLLATILQQKDEMIHSFLESRLPSELLEKLTQPDRISTWFPILIDHLDDVKSSLNQLDQYLYEKSRYLFVTYDNLDVMAISEKEKRSLLQALLRLWLRQWGRWQRIRPKIFLRFDLFAPEYLQFPDASKLHGHKLELSWKPIHLYPLVFKVWANCNSASLEYLQSIENEFKSNTRQHSLLPSLTLDKVLGWTYHIEFYSDDFLRYTVHQILGQFMGSGPKKGRSFEWILNHIQDANEEIVPRSMLNIFSHAAQDELEHHRAKSNFLLSPQSIHQALEKVSEHRIDELLDEYRWLEALRPRLENEHVPIEKKDFLEILENIDWTAYQSLFADKHSPSIMLNYLLQLGILRQSTDKRIHVPDIYLYGFKMKRKGGIRRPPH